MKILLSLCCLVGFSALATATVDPYDIVVLADKSSESVVFRSTLPVEHTTDFEIWTNYGRLLFQEELPSGAFLDKRFKSNNFPTGKYKLVISDELGRMELLIQLSATGITVNRHEAKQTLFPIVDLRNARTLVVDCRNEPGHDVSLSLTNKAGAEIFRENLEGGKPIRKSYRLDQLAAGDYVVTISSKTVKKYTSAFTLD